MVTDVCVTRFAKPLIVTFIDITERLLFEGGRNKLVICQMVIDPVTAMSRGTTLNR